MEEEESAEEESLDDELPDDLSDEELPGVFFDGERPDDDSADNESLPACAGPAAINPVNASTRTIQPEFLMPRPDNVADRQMRTAMTRLRFIAGYARRQGNP